MKYFGFFIRLLAIILLIEDHLVQGKNMTIQIVNHKEMSKLLKQYPNIVEMTKMAINPRATWWYPEGRNTVTYTCGTGRVAGDKLVASEFSTNDYKVPTTISAKISYPSSGTGAIVTFVKINVYQSNDDGRAYVASGGIGSNNIVVIVSAENTYYFDINTQIYGK